MIVLPDGGEKIPFEGFINFCVKKKKKKRCCGGGGRRAPLELTDISLLPPFVIV